jgi:hypothetical protein
VIAPVNIESADGFVNPPRDTRSSLYLEASATECQMQGLALDWKIVTREADLCWRGSDWRFQSVRGAKWPDVKNPERRQYLKNAYRVLLTRARPGMLIFVPPGARRDRTLSPTLYEGIYDYLKQGGTEVYCLSRSISPPVARALPSTMFSHGNTCGTPLS